MVDKAARARAKAGRGRKARGCPMAVARPDTSCPTVMPHLGSPCAGALSCDYAAGAVVPWAFTCDAGRWDGGPDCSMVIGGCPVPPPAEGCSDAFAGQLAGASVAVGPAELAEAFRAYDAGEEPSIEWGSQGSAMIFFRVQVTSDAAPECAMISATVAPAGLTPVTTTSPTTMRCGETLRMYVVLPVGSCDATEPVDTTLSIDIAGVGATEVELSVPADAFCDDFL